VGLAPTGKRRLITAHANSGLMHYNRFAEIHWRKSDLKFDRTWVVRDW
jgi:hypothetical protein